MEQLSALRALGCDLIQGYLLAHPLEANDLIAWEIRHRRRWKTLIRPLEEMPVERKAAEGR